MSLPKESIPDLVDSAFDDSGPSRQTAQTVIERSIATLKDRLAALEQLLKLVEGVEVGSPLEHLLWDIFSSHQMLR